MRLMKTICGRNKIQRRNLIIILGVFLTAVMSTGSIWYYRPQFLQYAAKSWVVSDPIGTADAAVLLGGNSRDRPLAVAELFRNGLVNQILVDTDEDKEALLNLNIPPQTIAYFGRDLRNTYEEACALVHLAERRRLKRIIIPIEPFSSRRVHWVVARALAQDGITVAIEVLPEQTIKNWWVNAGKRAEFRTEITKYLYYRIRYQFSKCAA